VPSAIYRSFVILLKRIKGGMLKRRRFRGISGGKGDRLPTKAGRRLGLNQVLQKRGEKTRSSRELHRRAGWKGDPEDMVVSDGFKKRNWKKKTLLYV